MNRLNFELVLHCTGATLAHCYLANAANVANSANAFCAGDVATAATLVTTATNQPKNRDFVATVASRHGVEVPSPLPKPAQSVATVAGVATVAVSPAVQPDPGMARLLALAACTPMQARATVTPKAKAPVCNDTLEQVVAAPTVSGVLSCLNSWGLVRLHGFRMVYGRGGGYPQGRPHGLLRVVNHHAHHLCVTTHPVVLKSQQGAKTMQVNPMGQTAPTPKAAPATSTPTSASTEAQAQALLEVITAHVMAGRYIRDSNIPGARRKLRQTLQALHTLEVAYPTITKGITA